MGLSPRVKMGAGLGIIMIKRCGDGGCSCAIELAFACKCMGDGNLFPFLF